LDINLKRNDIGLASEATLAALNAKLPAQGQAVMAASVPIAIASDQAAIPVEIQAEVAFADSNVGVTVAGTGLTTIYEEADVTTISKLAFEITETGGAQALDAFEVQAKIHAASSYVTLYSTSTDFTSPKGVLVGTSGDLTALAASETGWLVMDTEGFISVRLQASAAADSATINVYVGGN
jgi:hypothetical protein